MRNPNLSDFDKDLLIHFFQHHADGKLRGKLMREYPGTYNRLIGDRLVKSVYAKGEHEGEEL